MTKDDQKYDRKTRGNSHEVRVFLPSFQAISDMI